MLNIELSNKDITGPGLYLMQWKKQTGLVRIVGQPKTGYKIISPEKPSEHYFQGLPEKGEIPADALLSEPLNVVKA